MADLERITPPVPTLPTPIGRNVSNRRRKPESDPKSRPEPEPGSGPQPNRPESDHIDEYV
jgi:hypothetical protein